MKRITKYGKLFGALAMAGFMICGCISTFIASAAGVTVRKNYYNSDYADRASLLEDGAALSNEIYGEGIVMLKNEDNALPIAKGAKISVFSKNSNQNSIRASLSTAGYSVNPTLASFYSDNTLSGSGRGTAPSNGNITAGYNTGETPVSMYTQDVKDSFADYNDAAIVVIYRVSGEGNDAARTMKWDGEQYQNWNVNSTQLVPGARNTDDHYLQLDQNETDMLALCAQNFDKVVVLFQTPSSFETGFLDDPGHYAYQEKIKAALYIGTPLSMAAKSDTLGKVLQGEINPSGRVVDTWARDFKLDPTWQNFGNYLELKGNQYTNLPSTMSSGGYVNNYVTYNEGIYVGYRYWETRGYTEGAAAYDSTPADGSDGNEIHGTTTTDWENWYRAHVVYPYGYGLSYTAFTQEIVATMPEAGSEITADTEFSVNVKVTNTGSAAGKEVVQIYYTAPYKAGQIEKAHVLLADFAKTEILQPGESQIVTLTFDAYDMASYDYSDANANGFKGYELDDGVYSVRLMKNAHEEIESVQYTVGAGIQYRTDPVTGNTVENRFDEVSSYITDSVADGGLGQKYLSRNDWEGTWPVKNVKLTASQRVMDGFTEWKVVSGVQTRDPDADIGQPYYTTQMPATEVQSGVVLSDLHGRDYDDELWETFLDQFSVAQLTELVTQGDYYGGADYPEFGVKRMGNYDSRGVLWVVKGHLNGSRLPTTELGDVILVAQTFNEDLAYRFGKQIGEEALWCTDSKYGAGAWYAPSINIHRSQFGGRNNQYYGEDAVLSGKMAAKMIQGAQEKGFPTYLKHFAVNNQETNRCGLATWANEQSMREIYFKGFEIGVKEGKTLGIMSSLNRIGTTWAGGDYQLLTEVLRNEWGFKGSVVTDSYLGDSSNISCADQMIRAGGNLALGSSTLKYNVGTATTVSCLREMAHGLLYLMAHSNAINAFEQGNYKPFDSFMGGILNTATVGVSFNADIATARLNKTLFPDADDGDITYSVAEGSRLPEGLTLSKNGVISGKPTKEENNYRFTVKASYAGNTTTADFTISIVNVNGSIVYQAETDLGVSEINQSLNLSVAGASIVKPNVAEGEVLPTVTYSLKSGSALPEGLTLSAEGVITGTPTKECADYEFTVLANADGYSSVALDFKISVFYKTTFFGGTLQNGKIGINYLDRISVGTSQNPITYTLEGNLPAGLTLTSQGYITGKPTETVTDYKFVIVANADFALPVKAEYTISIGISFNNKLTLNDAKKGEEYYMPVNMADGGTAEVAYVLKEGVTLPEGLTLSADGVITGTPTEAGTYEITVLAQSDGIIPDEITLSLYVADTENAGGIYGIIFGIGGGVVLLGVAAGVFFFLKKKPASKKCEPKKSSPVLTQEPKEKTLKENVSVPPKGDGGGGKRRSKSLGVFSVVFLSLFVVIFSITLVLTQNNFLYFTICSVIGGSERYLKEGNPADYQYYSADYAKKAAVLKAANELNERIVEEGIVLLKNENDTALPLTREKKITVFGKNSVDLVLGGSGSNAGASSAVDVDLCASLETAGFECNPIIKAFYKDDNRSGSGRPTVPAMGDVITGFPVSETPVASYTQEVRNSYTQYNDAAIVILSRIGGEGYDLPRTMFWNGNSYTDWSGDKSAKTIPGARSQDDHYLQLDQNETDMLKEACDNFDKVIVVVNSASPIELGFLDDASHYAYNAAIKGALWLGDPGVSGVNALGRVLNGTVNPSGRTTDTYPRNFKNDPTWYNFGNHLSANGNRYTQSGKERNAWFVEYREGIYTGYRYYETRGYTEGGTWYEDNVVYPFGYGKSYTQFSHSVTPSVADGSTLTKEGKLSFEVEVTNIGTQYDGKEVVQLYYTAEYKNGIEKPHVVLGDFAKTELLKKNNGTGKVTLEIDVRDMASYDYNDANGNDFKGYETEGGTYTVYITNNAHGWADGDVTKFTYIVPAGGFTYEKDETTDTPIKNLFDDVSAGISQNNYLSRKNNFANFNALKGASEASYREKSTDFISSLTYKLNDRESDPWYVTDAPDQSRNVLSRQETEVKLYDLIGKDYRDALWDKLLDQLTVSQMVSLISTGNFRTLALENIDKPLTTDADGPMGYAVFMGDPTVYDTCFYASECVLAATFNIELAYEMGKMVGNEGVIGNEGGDGRPYAGWYAPAVNLHRSQFGGRNFEYYSEDGYLSGAMAQKVIKGAREKGVYTYLKHFALNEQETKRDETGLITWANEQSMRENYFVPFEMCVKEGKTTAMMSAFNRLGATWAGGNYNLLTELLRNEWGFEGMVITDYNLKTYMNTDQMIRAGGDLNLSGGKSPASLTTATDIASVRRAAKNILFTIANSCAMNGYGPGVIWGYTMPWWVCWLIVVDCVIFATDAVLWILYIIKKKKN